MLEVAEIPKSSTISQLPPRDEGMNQTHMETDDAWIVAEGNLNDLPFVVSELTPVLPVCVNKAALQHVPPDQGPALCTVGAVVEAVSWPRGLGELSASILPASNA